MAELNYRERNEAFNQAFEKLSPDEKTVIDGMAKTILDTFKANHPTMQFTYDNALEIIASIGILAQKRKGILPA